jgi:hypothetical protein
MKPTTLGKVVAAALVVASTGVLASPTAWGVQANPNFAGYQESVVANASADITVPATSALGCPTVKELIVTSWVALLKGQYAAYTGLVVKCINGSPIMYVSGVAGTVSFHFPVNGGDVVSLSASETATATTVTAEDTNTTANAAISFAGGTPTPTVVDIGAFSTSTKIPEFGSLTFSSVEVDGTTLPSSATTTHRISRHHKPVVTAGPVSSGSFTLTES